MPKRSAAEPTSGERLAADQAYAPGEDTGREPNVREQLTRHVGFATFTVRFDGISAVRPRRAYQITDRGNDDPDCYGARFRSSGGCRVATIGGHDHGPNKG